MTDSPAPAPLDIRPAKAGAKRRLSLVWFVPVLALLISLGVAYQNYANRGTMIEIAFENASGITAGETVVKYRDVEIGRVDKVAFAEGLGDVIITAEIDNEVAPFLDDDAQFWVIQPDVSLRGVSGLSTVLSGVYIEGSWDTEADVQQYSFTGLADPPLIRNDQRGTQIVLRSRDGSSLADGAPILHKGIQVGFLETPRLSFDGQSVTVNAFIEAPFDRRITTATRFWDASGFSVNFGTSGLELDVNSLASLIEGGIAFDTVVSGGDPIRDGQLYDLFPDEETARDSLFSGPDVPVVNFAVLFDSTVNGLTKGSEVRFRGIRIGSVEDLSAIVVDGRDGSQVQLRTVLAIEPDRLGMGENTSAAAAIDLIDEFVANQGLRARLATGNILSGALVVELVEIADAPQMALDVDAVPYPIIPTTASAITDVAQSAEGVLTRINDLPIEQLMNSAIDMLDSIERLANEDSFRQAPQELVGLLEDTRALVASDDLQAVPGELRSMINGMDDIVTGIAQAQLAAKLTETLDNANALTANLQAGTENLPEISQEVTALLNKANALELDALVSEATATLDAINALVGSESTQDIPASLSSALDEMGLFLAEVRQGGAINNVNAALASASEAARAIEQSVEGLPALANRASALVTQTEDVIASYGDRSRFSNETLATLREIQAAADAVSALARTIQRNPNSLLTGR